MQAFYSQLNLPFSEAAQKLFMATLFGKESVRTYHDYLPKPVKKILYTSIKEWQDAQIKPYLYGTMMEYNGMSLIREAYQVLLIGPVRRFMVMERYIKEITNFLKWYNRNKDHTEFKYFWYSHPERLEDVSQAKCQNLYSAVLKHLKTNGLMTGYKSSNLNPESVPPEDLVLNAILLPDSGSASELLTPEYYRLLKRHPAHPWYDQYNVGVQQSQSLLSLQQAHFR